MRQKEKKISITSYNILENTGYLGTALRWSWGVEFLCLLRQHHLRKGREGGKDKVSVNEHETSQCDSMHLHELYFVLNYEKGQRRRDWVNR